MKTIVMAVSALLLAAPLTCAGAVSAAEAAPPVRYANCTAMNKVYPHGVGRRGAVDKTTGVKVRNFTVNDALYKTNAHLDRDKDGIACEKR